MAADLGKLDAQFGEACRRLLQDCRDRGIEMRPNEGLRDPWTQAKYWRQSRSIQEINNNIAMLRNKGANFIAKVLEDVGPQHGDPVTKALPGASWHQWGLALDCFWVVNGVAEWSTQRQVNGVNGYRFYADAAEGRGLTAGGHWPTFKDWPHVQASGPSSPLGKFSWAEIDAEMQRLFSQ